MYASQIFLYLKAQEQTMFFNGQMIHHGMIIMCQSINDVARNHDLEIIFLTILQHNSKVIHFYHIYFIIYSVVF